MLVQREQRPAYYRAALAILLILLIPLQSCGNKGLAAKRRIRDLRYSRELQVEMIEPRFERRTWEEAIPTLITHEENFEVQGRIRDRQARVRSFVNGAQVPVDGPDEKTGRFEIRAIRLQEGKNEIVIEVKSGSKANEERFTVTRVKEKKLEITAPLANSFIKDKWITVYGEADLELQNIQVNGRPAKRVAEKSRGFSVEGVSVRDDENYLVASARDEQSNIWRVTTRVVRDVTPPRIAIDYPPPGATTNQTEITIEGSVDDHQARLEINGEVIPIAPDGKFQATVPIVGLEGNFHFVARDPAGNRSDEQRVVRVDNELPGISIMSPQSGALVSQAPMELRLHSSKVPANLHVVVDGETIAETKVTQSPFSYSIAEIPVADGSHKLTLRVLDDAGNKAEQTIAVRTDVQAPKIEIRGVANGMTAERVTVNVLIDDPSLDSSSVRITMNGKPFPNGSTLTYQAAGRGEKILEVQARDRYGHSSREQVQFNLAPNNLAAYLADLEDLWWGDTRRRQRLVEPLLVDLRRAGALQKVLDAYDKIAENTTAKPPHPTDPDIVDTFDAFEALYPKLYEMDEVRDFYAANRDIARDGLLEGLAEVLAEANRLGAWEVFDELLKAISTSDEKGHSELTDVLEIARAFAKYPKRREMFAALAELPDIELDFNPKTKDDFFDIPLELLSAFFEQTPEDFNGLIDYQASIVDGGAHKLAPRAAYELVEMGRGQNFVTIAYDALACVLGQKQGRPYDRLLKAWAAFINAYLKDSRRHEITQGVLKIAKSALMNDVLDSAAVIMNYPDIAALHEAFQILSRLEVFDKLLTDVAKILASKDVDGRPVVYSLLIALDGFFERDEVHPNQTYAETMLDGVERLLKRDAQGRNSLEIVTDVFLDDLTQAQRLKFGEIFKYHTLPNGEKVLAKGREYPSDNQRLLKLMDIAYSPLNCGMPIAFTNVVVPINLPGMPIKFPSKNVAVDAFEAAAKFEASTVERFANLFDVLVKTASIGDLFCEPDILSELVADPAPIRALIRNTPLKESFTMIQALAKRGDAPYLVEMVHSLYLSGASGLFDPTMNAVFEQGVVENFIASLKTVRETPLKSNPKRKALSVFLDLVAYTLRVPPGHRQRVVRPFLMLFDRIISDDEIRDLIQVQLQFVSEVLNNPPAGLDLHDLDNIVGEIYGCDRDGRATRAFAKFLDSDKNNGDFRYLLKHARTYLNAPPDLAIAFNKLLARVLDRGAVTEALFLVQNWVEIDKRHDLVLQQSLAEALRPDRNDHAALDPLLHAVLKTAAPTIKNGREPIKNAIQEKNRPTIRRIMRHPFNIMGAEGNAKESYMERMIPAAQIFLNKKTPDGKEYYMNAVNRGFHVLLREGMTRAVADAHEVAWKSGYYDPKRDPDLIQAFVEVMNTSLKKWPKQATRNP